MCEIIPVDTQQCYDLYVNSFRDPERQERIIKRLQEVGVKGKIYNFTENDPRADEVFEHNCKHKREDANFGNVYSMLKMIEDFYKFSNKEYCVILENDVFLKKSFAYDVSKMCKVLTQLELDVLLIGHLLTCTPAQAGYIEIHRDEDNNTYYAFPDDLWGSHGFIFNKKHAKYLIDTLTFQFVGNMDGNGADWVFTKLGKRVLVNPVLVVEEGFIKADHQGQANFHMQCRHFQYNDSYTK